MAGASYSRPDRQSVPTAVRLQPGLVVFRLGSTWVAFHGRPSDGTSSAGGAPVEAGAALGAVARHVPAAADVAPAWLRQVHGTRIRRADRPGPAGEGDALIVSGTVVAATVFVADCVPVLIAARGAVASVHAGWRGLAAGVLASAVAEIAGGSAARLAESTAWIGPAIGPCCYEVDEDVARRVEGPSGEGVVQRRTGHKPHLDLQLAASRQLAALGVACAEPLACCVRCSPHWWSYRGDGPCAGRNHGFIWRT